MKILYDHQIFINQKFGGISRYFNEIMKIGNVNGIEVERIFPDLLYPQTNIQKSPLHERGIKYIKRKLKVEVPVKPAELPVEITNKLLGVSYDIFHPTYYDTYFIKKIKKPFVLTVYDMIHEIYREYFSIADPTSANKRLLCEKASKIIAISNTTKNDLADIFNIPSEKIEAIHLASDFNKVEAIKPQQTEGLENYILFVGVRKLYKNFYFALTALAEVLKQDKHLQFLCTGHPFDNDELNFFKELGIEDQIKHIYLENDNELAWVYQNAVLFIFPSLYEGFGFPLLEAFASRCPVISSNGGSLPEVGGDAALYFNPRNIHEIRDAACKALYNDTLKKNMINKGIKVFKEFSWDKCRKRTIEVYKSVNY